MALNMTLMFDREVPGVLGKCVEGYDLIRGKTMEKLGRITEGLGVRPIHDFDRFPPLDHLPEEARVAMRIGYWDEDSWGPNPSDREPLWHDPAEGLATLQAVLTHLREHPRAIRAGVAGLREMERAMRAAADTAVRFHVYYDV